MSTRDFIPGNFLPSLAGLVVRLDPTQHCVLGYSRPSLPGLVPIIPQAVIYALVWLVPASKLNLNKSEVQPSPSTGSGQALRDSFGQLPGSHTRSKARPLMRS